MFTGLKVIELASVLAGPAVGQFFAELGAKVIKVENVIQGGDVTRSWRLVREKTDSRTAYFCSVNWGKKSLNLNLRTPEDLKGFYKLVEDADIVIASLKPGASEKLKVSYEHLKKINPRIIYGIISGFGDDNPRVGYDAIIQAEYGFMSMNGEKGGKPLKMPVALMDVLAAHQMKEALLLALLHRERSGEGSRVSVSLAESAMASLMNQATNYLMGDHVATRQGSLHPNIAPYGEMFETADKVYFMLAIGTDHQFRALCDLLDSQLYNKKAFSNNQNRVKNREALKGELAQLISELKFVHLEEGMLERHIPFGKIRNIKEVTTSSEAQEMLFDDGFCKSFKGNAFKLSFISPNQPESPPELPDLE